MVNASQRIEHGLQALVALGYEQFFADASLGGFEWCWDFVEYGEDGKLLLAGYKHRHRRSNFTNF